MSARTDLLSMLLYGIDEAGAGATAVDAYAHELAEQIRVEADEWTGWPEKQAVMRFTADLIDPEAQR